MEKKENQRIKITKKMLKESLLCLIKEKNLQKISVSELCKNAGINRATFYNHYTVPSDVLAEIGNDMTEEIRELLKKSGLYNSGTFQEKIELICTYLLENRETAKILFQNNTPESDFAARLFHGQNNWEQTSKKMSRLYGEEGKDLLLTYFVYGSYYMVAKWLIEEIKKTPAEMGKMISGIRYQSLQIS